MILTQSTLKKGNCEKLIIKSKTPTIADGAFKGLPSLSTIELAAGNTNFTVDDNVLYNKEKTKILCFPQLRAGEYTMPATITEMGDYQFYNCVNLTGVTLSNAIQTIGQYAFYSCVSLESVSIPDGVQVLSDYCFRKSFNPRPYERGDCRRCLLSSA